MKKLEQRKKKGEEEILKEIELLAGDIKLKKEDIEDEEIDWNNIIG